MLRCPVYVQLTHSRGLSRKGEGEGRQQSQAAPPDILTPSCIYVLSPWKLGLSSTWRALNRSPLLLTRGWCCEYGSVRSASSLLLHCLTLWSRAAFFSLGTEELCGAPSLSLCALRVCGGGTEGVCDLCGRSLSVVSL